MESGLMKDLMLVGALKDELKNRSRVFNVCEKEACAKTFGLRFDAFYDLPYKLWIMQDQRMYELINAMSRDIDEVEAWCGQDLHKTSFANWMHVYHDWLSEN